MQAAFDPIRLRGLLQRGIDRGLWTLEHLDCPSLYAQSLLGASKAAARHRNLLRDPEPPSAPSQPLPAPSPVPSPSELGIELPPDTDHVTGLSIDEV